MLMSIGILSPDMSTGRIHRRDYGVNYDNNGYSIKIADISQRGNIVEVMTTICSPDNSSILPYNINYPIDIIKIQKDDLSKKRELIFIFKDKSSF